MSTILVTGATGFIGGHLCESLLEQGHAVRCLVRAPQRAQWLEQRGAQLVAGDVLDREALEQGLQGVDLVYHVAGLTRAFSVDELYQTNCRGSEALGEACAAASEPPTVIAVSSIAAAGPAARGTLRRESDEPQPISNYGRSKLAGEEALRRFARQVPLSIVRPGVVFGERDDALWRIVNSLRFLRTHFVPGLRSGPLSCIYVGDLVRLLQLTAERGQRLDAARPGQGVYNACHHEHPTYSQIGRIMAQGLGHRVTLRLHLPAPLAWGYGGFAELVGHAIGRPSVVNIDKIREALQSSWASSNQAACRELNFEPSGALDEQLKQTARSYLQPSWRQVVVPALPRERVRSS